MPLHGLLMKKAFDTRIPLPRIHHFERKREIFFVRGKAKDVRGTASEKHRTPCAPPKRCFMQTVPHRKRNAANEKDPSAALGMTIRETVLSDAEALLLRARNDECGRKAEMLEAAATISQSPLFPQNIPAFLKIGAVNKAVSHRYCLLFHTAKHRAAA